MRFTARSAVTPYACALLLAVVAVALGPLPAHAAEAPATFVTMIGESGDYISGGAARMYRPGNATITLTGTSKNVQVDVSGGASGDYFTFNFDAPDTQDLQPGLYENVQRFPFNTGSRAGLSVYGSGRGCNTLAGQFRILDIHVDENGAVDRFDATYAQRCGTSAAVLYGHVRYNVPGGDSDLVVAGREIDFPLRDVGVGSRLTPVWIQNTAVQPVTMSQASIDGANADSFSVSSDTCSGTTVAAGGSCLLYVRFTPQASGSLAAALQIPNNTAAGNHPVALRGSGAAGYTRVALISTAGDYIGAGANYTYTPQTSTVTATGTDAFVTVSISAGSTSWTANFHAGELGALVPGTYSAAERYPFNGNSPGLAFTGNGRGCNEIAGEFTIHEAAFSATNGALERFSVTFEQHCDSSSGALYGSIAWRATNPAEPPPAPPPDTTPPAPVADLVARGRVAGAASLSWVPPADYATAMVRVAPGSVPPATPTAGQLARSTADASATLHFPLGKTYSVSVFAADAAGNYSSPASATLVPTKTTLTLSRSTISYGRKVRVVGHVVKAATGRDLPGHPVGVYGRKTTQAAWTLMRTVITDEDGLVDLHIQRDANSEIYVAAMGAPGVFGSKATPRTLLVRPDVTAALTGTRTTPGEPVGLMVHVAPRHAGHPVVLQQYRAGSWEGVSRHTLDDYSRAAWRITPQRTGTLKFRVLSPGHADHLASASNVVRLEVR